MNNSLTRLALLLAALAAISACTERDGPAENLGERIDDAAEEVREGAEEVGDALQE